MKILFYLSAGSGDLINFTGVLEAIKITHVNYQLDLLIPKKHFYIVENNPCISNVLFIDDYPNIPNHCQTPNHDSVITKMFKSKYDHVLNCWGCKYQGENNGDYANIMFNLMKQYGFVLPYTRLDINPRFYYGLKDYQEVDALAKLSTKPTILIEQESFSWKSEQLPHLPGIKNYLRSAGYITAGNNPDDDICTKQLNLKQLKLFFEQQCTGFLGLSSGMTCAMYALPNHFIGKRVVVSGMFNGWNVKPHIASLHGYNYFNTPYTVEDIQILFKKV